MPRSFSGGFDSPQSKDKCMYIESQGTSGKGKFRETAVIVVHLLIIHQKAINQNSRMHTSRIDKRLSSWYQDRREGMKMKAWKEWNRYGWKQ